MEFKSNMSMFSMRTGRTNISSILKSSYSNEHRNNMKEAIINRVRFAVPKQDGLLSAIKAATRGEFIPLNEFVSYLRNSDLDDASLLIILKDAHKIVNYLNENFKSLVEVLLSINWLQRSTQVREAFVDFFVDLMVAYNQYLQFGMGQLIALWLPLESTDSKNWSIDKLEDLLVADELKLVHKVHDRMLNIIPMSFNATLEAIENHFPYFKKPYYMLVGYLHNMLTLVDHKPIFTENILNLIMSKLVVLDVNTPRAEIIDLEDSDDEEENYTSTIDISPMKHPVAHNLDVCMLKLFEYFSKKFNCNQSQSSNDMKRSLTSMEKIKLFDLLMKSFDVAILPTHNTQYIQFILFYVCSFKHSYVESFLSNLWSKAKDSRCSAVFRQASIGYMASLMARAKYLNISIIKRYLNEFSIWAQEYIKNTRKYYLSGSVKAHIIFYSMCQAIFYVIAFRSRDLTADKKCIMFLQSLHLPALVNCHLNPLRVCLPAVATAFAGVARYFQLAYCHAILERNARRKLATVYANDTATPEEVLETFFPFDPYILKLSCKYISEIYLVYEPHDFDESGNAISTIIEKEGITDNGKHCESNFLKTDDKVKDGIKRLKVN